MSFTPASESLSVSRGTPFEHLHGAQFEVVTLDSVTRDDTNTPTTNLRPGLVVGESSADAGKFVDAADATVQASAVAYVDSDEAPDTDWDGEDITVAAPELGVEVTVTLGGADDTLAEVIAALEADPTFSAHFTASDAGGGELRIAAQRKGVRIEVTSTLASAFGADGKTSEGTLTRFGILRDGVLSMLDIADTAADRNASAVVANARVYESRLYSLTNDARLWFARNGIILV